jgi:hypothetical protein
MAHLNQKGPDEKGPGTGRKLGRCEKKLSDLELADFKEIGVGEGKKRHNSACKNKGKRIYSGKNLLIE